MGIINITKKITVQGKEYNSIDDVPEEYRELIKKTIGELKLDNVKTDVKYKFNITKKIDTTNNVSGQPNQEPGQQNEGQFKQPQLITDSGAPNIVPLITTVIIIVLGYLVLRQVFPAVFK
jgi:hypothetical protein